MSESESWANSVQDDSLTELAELVGTDPEPEPEPENYTSKKFGMNRFQKINQELEQKVKILEEKCNQRSNELAELKKVHSQVLLEKGEKSRELEQTAQDYTQELEDIQSKNKKTSQEFENLERELLECKQKLKEANDSLDTIHQESEIKNKDLGEASTRYSQLKERYTQLEELYSNKVNNSKNTDVTIAELTNQLTLKNGQLETLKQEVLSLRKSTMDYREQNANYRKYLDDKDKFISTLNSTIEDYTFQIENGLTKKALEQEQTQSSRQSTQRVTTFSEPINLSIQSANKSVVNHSRAVPSTRRV